MRCHFEQFTMASSVVAKRTLLVSMFVLWFSVHSFDASTSDNTRIVSPGRHVCMRTQQVQRPVKRLQSYCQPAYHKQLRVCNRDGMNRLCTTFRVVYKTGFREVMTTEVTSRNVYMCCPGWTQKHPGDRGCMKRSFTKAQCTRQCKNGGQCVAGDVCQCKQGYTGEHCETAQCTRQCKNGGQCVAGDVCQCKQGYTGEHCETAVCSRECRNGGRCVSQTKCQCKAGWTGEHCQTDINECEAVANGCQHQCINTGGSFVCACQRGFKLAADGKTCELCLTCVTDYNNMVGDMKSIVKRLTNLEQGADVQQGQPVPALQQHEAHQVTDMNIQNTIEEKVKIAVKQTSDQLENTLKEKLQNYLSSYIKQEITSNIHQLKDSIKAELKDYFSTYFDKIIKSNLTKLRTSIDRDLTLQKYNLQIFRGSLARHNRTIMKYREEVELYKNDLKAELGRFKTELLSLKATIEELSNKRDSDYMDYGRMASLSNQIALLEEKIAECTCER